MVSSVRSAGTGDHPLGPPQPLNQALCPRDLPLLVTVVRSLPLGLGFLTSTVSSCIKAGVVNTNVSTAKEMTQMNWNGRVCGQEVGKDNTTALFHSRARVI